MSQENIYLSIPTIKFAENKVSNEDIIDKVKQNFTGSSIELKKIITGINYIFNYCDSKNRFLGVAEGKTPIDYVVEAGKQCCIDNNVKITEVDALIYGGIYRDYFEPATAMEVANKIGLKKIYAFDITNACAGMMQSVIVASALMKSDASINKVICCTTDFPDVAIDFNINSFSELDEKGAGLTLGSAASAWILSREPFEKGCLKLVDGMNTSFTETYSICQVPITSRKFSSLSKQIFDLGIEHIPVEIHKILKRTGWELNQIDHFISHQPGKKIIEKVCDKLNIDVAKAPIIHHLYGNTVNTTLPMSLEHLNKNSKLKNGNKIIMNTAAAGFTMVTIAGEWVKL
ncbi:MAG TPA: hypothetical protein DDX39_00410 [Bacteroidales bacterium]|nr:MAG: hypothetical protein A2W98_03145 [Bacteroidetes bacterium GWF2_33_38]OFY69821.1 MAG: hypothetical protein A2265_06110 [Bacteroidetes bacterium RIFOXYA12_FULL_33_9]OFY91878.1 MAG: hypothetical protein A2236_04855 [Bacteroidetes bacterium RIFOXYA2_FULL_33_7]HBF87072.1 hypothetical protein [Bacteroidales bacterium]